MSNVHAERVFCNHVIAVIAITTFSLVSIFAPKSFLYPRPIYFLLGGWVFGKWVLVSFLGLYFFLELTRRHISCIPAVAFGAGITSINIVYTIIYLEKGVEHQGIIYAILVCLLEVGYSLLLFKMRDTANWKFLNIYIFCGLACVFFPAIGELP